MKKLILFLFMYAGMHMYSFSQCAYYSYLQPNGVNEIVGCFTADSICFDLGPEYIYDFSHDEEIRDAWDNVEATYDRSTGIVYDQNNDIMFKVMSNGDILNDADWLMARIDEEGILWDNEDSAMGKVDPAVDKFFIAYFFLHWIY